jgi:hypothetical protein
MSDGTTAAAIGDQMTERSEYTVAGWLAIAAAIITVPMLVVGIALEIVARVSPAVVPLFMVIYTVVVLSHTVFTVYAFLRFRTMLNSRHQFHDVDALVTAIVVGVVLLTLFMIPAKFLGLIYSQDHVAIAIVLIAVMVCFAITMSVLSIVFAVRLLRLESNLNGLLKPYVWITIAAAACFAMFITAPLGLILDAAGNIILGLILLKPASDSLPDFV